MTNPTDDVDFHADGSVCWKWLCKCKKVPVTAEALESDKQGFIDLAEKIHVDKSFIIDECVEAMKDCNKGTFEQKTAAHNLLLILIDKLRQVLERERNLSNKWWMWHIRLADFLESTGGNVEKS